MSEFWEENELLCQPNNCYPLFMQSCWGGGGVEGNGFNFESPNRCFFDCFLSQNKSFLSFLLSVTLLSLTYNLTDLLQHFFFSSSVFVYSPPQICLVFQKQISQSACNMALKTERRKTFSPQHQYGQLTISKSSRTSFSDSPLYLLARLDVETLKNVVPHSVATALANMVLPVPGGPTINTPCMTSWC